MQVIGFIAMFFVLVPLFAKAISLLIRQFARIGQTEGLIVSLVLFFAWLAHEMGAPELLGGFAAGWRFFLLFVWLCMKIRISPGASKPRCSSSFNDSCQFFRDDWALT
jgi:hypothetical protein